MTSRFRTPRPASVAVVVFLIALATPPVLRAADPGPSAPASPVSTPRPNIVFVLFDDLGWPQVPAMRPESPFRLPNMDRMARGGMRFTDAHAAASVCTPTRYGVLTGRYPLRIGQYGVLTTFGKPIIDPARMTVGSMLRSAGYHTACIGKWHLGMNIQAKGKDTHNALPPGTPVADGPITRGFDVACVYPEARDIGLVIEGEKVLGNFKDVDVQPMMAEKAVQYIEGRAKAGGPFFLYLPLSTPHEPVVPAPPYAGKGGVAGKEKEYADWIYQGDDVLGRVLDALDRLKLADDTLVIATSDNGAAGRVYPPLRGSKSSIYEGGHREPFVARWPGRIKPATTCDDVICLNDLMATCAAVAGVKLPDDAAEDSVSLVPDLLGTATGPVREATIHQAPAGDLAIRQGPWKLIFPRSGPKVLYNLHDDLAETNDRAAGEPEVVAQLTALMRQYIDAGRSTPGAARENDVPVRLDGPNKPGKNKRKKDAEVRAALDPTFD